MGFVMVGVFAAVGANLRWILSLQMTGGLYFLSTAIVNMLGSFFAGHLYHAWISERFVHSKSIHEALMVGFLGALTTFSAFSLDNLKLFQQGEMIWLVANILGQLGLGLLLCYLGFNWAQTASS